MTGNRAEEARLVEALPVGSTPERLIQTAQTLRELRQLLERMPLPGHEENDDDALP